MLRPLKGVGLAALLLIIGWIASRDFCLFHNAPHAISLDIGALLLGLGAQILGVFLIWLIVQGRAHLILRTYVANNILKAALLVLPFVLVLFSHDLVAYALYNAGTNNKIESARSVDVAVRTCCALWYLWK